MRFHSGADEYECGDDDGYRYCCGCSGGCSCECDGYWLVALSICRVFFSRKVAWCRYVAETYGVVTEVVDAVVTTSDWMPSPVFFWGPPPTSFFI